MEYSAYFSGNAQHVECQGDTYRFSVQNAEGQIIQCTSMHTVCDNEQVFGVSCKNGRNGMTEGVVFSTRFQEIMETDGFCPFIEMTAYDYERVRNRDYTKLDQNGPIQPLTSEEYFMSLRNNKTRLDKGRIQTSRKNMYNYLLGIKLSDRLEFQYLYYRNIEPSNDIYTLNFLGKMCDDQNIHSIILNPKWNNVLNSNIESFRDLFSCADFRLFSQKLYFNSNKNIQLNTPVNIVLTARRWNKTSQNTMWFGRAVSVKEIILPNRQIEYGSKDFIISSGNHDVNLEIDNIYMATPSPTKNQYYPIKYVLILPTEEPAEPDRSELGFNVKNNTSETVVENQGEKVDENSKPIFSSIESEDYSIPENQPHKFNFSFIKEKISLEKIWLLHFDILEWCGRLIYVTATMIHRLMIAGIISDSYVLSEKEQKCISELSNKGNIEKTCTLKEDDKSIECKYLVGNNTVNDLMVSLFKDALLECVRFHNPKNDGRANTKIYFIGQNANKMLQVMGRKIKPYDFFAFAYPPFYIKSILSANQLFIAYICELKKSVVLDECNLKQTFMNDRVNIRPKFNVTYRKDENSSVLIFGESIRNYYGNSADFHRADLEDKTRRFQKVLDGYTREGEKCILEFVCETYADLKTTAEQISKAINNSCSFHILLTYDEAVYWNFMNAHFELDCNQGIVNKIENIEQYLNDI